MTGEQAITEYCEAINAHDLGQPETKRRVKSAREALVPFLKGGKLPPELLKVAKRVLR